MIFEIIGLILLVFVITFTIIIINIAKRNNNKISFKESMDLTELPIVTFSNKDQKLNFLLDTGSNISHINSFVLSSVEHEILNKNEAVIGMEGNIVNNQFCSMCIVYKEQNYTDEFSITDLGSAFDVIKQENGVQLHGILGSRFFEKYKYVLDFKDLVAYVK